MMSDRASTAALGADTTSFSRMAGEQNLSRAIAKEKAAQGHTVTATATGTGPVDLGVSESNIRNVKDFNGNDPAISNLALEAGDHLQENESPDTCKLCYRPQKEIICRSCGHECKGRVRIKCPIHSGIIMLMDHDHCPECKADVSELKEFA